jgi:hypothetical protein
MDHGRLSGTLFYLLVRVGVDRIPGNGPVMVGPTPIPSGRYLTSWVVMSPRLKSVSASRSCTSDALCTAASLPSPSTTRRCTASIHWLLAEDFPLLLFVTAALISPSCRADPVSQPANISARGFIDGVFLLPTHSVSPAAGQICLVSGHKDLVMGISIGSLYHQRTHLPQLPSRYNWERKALLIQLHKKAWGGGT